MPNSIVQRRIAILVAALLPACGLAGGHGWFTTSAGHRIETPAVEGLECDGMERVLRAIDRTGYRRGKPKPFDSRDMPLYDYEHRLAAAHFALCARDSAPEASRENGAPADGPFMKGYE